MSIVIIPSRFADDLQRLNVELRRNVASLNCPAHDLDTVLSRLESIAETYGDFDGDIAFEVHKRYAVLRCAAYEYVLPHSRPSRELRTLIQLFDELGHMHPHSWIGLRGELVAKLRDEGDDLEANRLRDQFGRLAGEMVEGLTEQLAMFKTE